MSFWDFDCRENLRWTFAKTDRVCNVFTCVSFKIGRFRLISHKFLHLVGDFSAHLFNPHSIFLLQIGMHGAPLSTDSIAIH